MQNGSGVPWSLPAMASKIPSGSVALVTTPPPYPGHCHLGAQSLPSSLPTPPHQPVTSTGLTSPGTAAQPGDMTMTFTYTATVTSLPLGGTWPPLGGLGEAGGGMGQKLQH